MIQMNKYYNKVISIHQGLEFKQIQHNIEKEITNSKKVERYSYVHSSVNVSPVEMTLTRPFVERLSIYIYI